MRRETGCSSAIGRGNPHSRSPPPPPSSPSSSVSSAHTQHTLRLSFGQMHFVKEKPTETNECYVQRANNSHAVNIMAIYNMKYITIHLSLSIYELRCTRTLCALNYFASRSRPQRSARSPVRNSACSTAEMSRTNERAAEARREKRRTKNEERKNINNSDGSDGSDSSDNNKMHTSLLPVADAHALTHTPPPPPLARTFDEKCVLTMSRCMHEYSKFERSGVGAYSALYARMFRAERRPRSE